MTHEVISHYRLLEKLGEGGMGEVYRAEDTLLRRTVALKFLTPRETSRPATQARFLREAQAGAVLDHPNICPVYGFEEAGGLAFIVMAFVDGTPLSRRLRQGITLGEAVEWMIGIGEGLKYAHEHGVIHRDIKAANVLLAKSGTPRITDFGLAKIENRSRLTVPGSILGTIQCLAPEQVLGEDADCRTDIWASGVLLFEMLTGHSPFQRSRAEHTMQAILNATTPALHSFVPELPAALDSIVQKALAKSRDERYQHMDDFVVDLRAVQRRLTPEQVRLPLPSACNQPALGSTMTLRKSAILTSGLGWPLWAAAAVLLALVALGFYVSR